MNVSLIQLQDLCIKKKLYIHSKQEGRKPPCDQPSWEVIIHSIFAWKRIVIRSSRGWKSDRFGCWHKKSGLLSGRPLSKDDCLSVSRETLNYWTIRDRTTEPLASVTFTEYLPAVAGVANVSSADWAILETTWRSITQPNTSITSTEEKDTYCFCDLTQFRKLTDRTN